MRRYRYREADDLMTRKVVIDCFPESLSRYRDSWAVVAVDVIRATTTAVTATVSGRECFPVPSLEVAVPLAARLHDPLLAGELGGNKPYGFHLNNSPAALARRTDVERPMILLSTTGTRLICESGPCEAVYVACLRNVTAQVDRLVDRHAWVAVVGAGARGEFREEDQLCCAWIAQGLMEAGYEPQAETASIVARWRGLPAEAFVDGKSTEYLKQTDQLHDLDFILDHVDDVDATFMLLEVGLPLLAIAPEAGRLVTDSRQGGGR
jgi:2-phosphosulfolactate phosphatase